jgi:uncharacterized protein YdeI (YjbR/CyaY-like superfamily)
METLSFPSSPEFRAWLETNHRKSPGIWLCVGKVNSSNPTVTYSEALDEALCFGWIDGQKKSRDSQSWLQKFTPRRSGSQWSNKNTERAERLISAGRMAPAGREEVEAARNDGRWKAAYDSFSTAKAPEDFLQALRENKKAAAFFETLNKTNLYSISYRLQTARKAETRQRRIDKIIAMLESGQKFH